MTVVHKKVKGLLDFITKGPGFKEKSNLKLV